MRSGPATLAVLAALAASAGAAPARAQDALTANDFAIDVHTGPVLASSRVVGLGGAYAGISDGIDGAPGNPASYAARTLYELSWFEWELAFGFLLPGSFANNDFDNNGKTGFSFDDFLFITLGLRLQLANVGFGALARGQTYRINEDGVAVDVSLTIANSGLAYQFFGGDLVVGAGTRTVSLAADLVGSSCTSASSSGRGCRLVEFTGSGVELGALYRPEGLPFRLGVSGRSPVFSFATLDVPTDSDGVRRVGRVVMPSEVHMPWEVSIGGALLLGERPLNRRWVNPHDEEDRLERALRVERALRARRQVAREMDAERAAGGRPAIDVRESGGVAPRGPRDPRWLAAEARRRAEEDEALEARFDRIEEAREREVEELSRLYLLVSAEALVTGRTPDGVGFESFLSQVRERSGDSVTVGLRLGLEGEPWPGRLKLRVGSYLEPSRFEGIGYRVHGTAGLELKLFRWDVFGLFDAFDIRVGAVADVAERYFDWGVGVGIWH